MPSLASERETVQDPLIKYVSEIGWEFVPRKKAERLRGGTQGLLFSSIIKEGLIALNPGLITSKKVGEVIHKIESVCYDIRGNRDALGWMRGEKSIYSEGEKRELNVSVIDYANPDNNVFQVTDEWTTVGARHNRRADVVFLINGIPVAIVETKSATKKDAIEEGVTQIRQYHRDTPGMLALPQVFDVTNLLELHYGATWNMEAKNIFNWKDEERGDFERKVKKFFDHERFLKLIKEWVLFYQKDDELKKTVLRQHQTQAAERIIERCIDVRKKRGLIWHTQGSGKTFTMIKAAELLLKDRERFLNPTVITMIDRTELEGQLSSWISALIESNQSFGIDIRRANSKKELRTILRADFRGLVVSMIHKFDNMPANVSDRDDVFVFIDEAHRSVGGELGNYLTGALPNATLIGFTGTPIDKTAYGKGTFKTFGIEDEQGYLDKYSIRESIEDGTTVCLKYKLTPMEMRVPKETLNKEFLEMADAEGLSDIEQLNKVLEKAVNLKNFLKSYERVGKVSDFVAEHFKKNIEPLGYKAFLVGVDREACALYKRALDERLPSESVKAVYTKSQHDAQRFPLVAKYQLSEDEEKSLRKEFVKPDRNPRIFIVTDKLLTGFDAPILYCMYLDKPMRDHVLLQSIARVNRPLSLNGKEKPCGLIVDFIGLLNNLEKALAFDSQDVSGVIEDIEVLFDSFENKMKESQKYLTLTCIGKNDKAVENVIDYFAHREKRGKFLKLFREIQTLYEILSPDPKLRTFLEDYKKLCVLYNIVMEEFEKEKLPLEYKELATKTESLVREEINSYEANKKVKEAVIDEKTLAQITEGRKSESGKIFNLTKLIMTAVKENPEQEIILTSIGERAQKVKEIYDDRRETAQQTLEELMKLAKETVELKRKYQKGGITARQLAFANVLEKADASNAESLTLELEEAFDSFSNYLENINQRRALKSTLYRILTPAIGEGSDVSVIKEIIELDERFKKKV